uniref:Arrestin C-terminal-like domain-containing protein n=1 Tax=Tetraodon nigroviridis TaxID=99883 RepID=H3DDA7_TETNG
MFSKCNHKKRRRVGQASVASWFSTFGDHCWRRMTITNFSIEYDAINSRNTFTNGDTINGRIVVEVSKETTIQALIFIGQGEAQVCWSEQLGLHHQQQYQQNEKYYKIKHYILKESRQDGTEVIGKGRHVFPFSFQIPDRNIPSTFKSSVGKIVHKLKAELKQSLRLTKKARTHFTFVSKANLALLTLMEPQYGCRNKSLTLSSGGVFMHIKTDRMGYMQGETIQVTLEITNCSCRSVKPTFALYERQSFFAQGKRTVHARNILKVMAEAIEGGKKKAVTQLINLPMELPSSIFNCSIIKLEYRLKAYLDNKCARDPEVTIPIVVLPNLRGPAERSPPAAAGIGLEGFGSPDRSQQTVLPRQQASLDQEDQPPSYEACAMYPPLPDYKEYQNTL